jgi:hypothetical protein
MSLGTTRALRFLVSALLFASTFGCDGEGDDGPSGDGSAGDGAAGEGATDGSGASGGTGGTSGTGGSGATPGDCDDDEFALNGNLYTEAPSDGDPLVCDAQIMAARYDDFVGMGVGYNLLLHWDYAADAESFGNFVSINIYGDEPGEYEFGPTAAGAADFVWEIGDDTPLLCLADSGSVTVDTLGMEGELVTGLLDLGISNTDCPATVSGTFSMTVVDGGSLMD